MSRGGRSVRSVGAVLAVLPQQWGRMFRGRRLPHLALRSASQAAIPAAERPATITCHCLLSRGASGNHRFGDHRLGNS